MAEKTVIADTTILIDYFRKTDKANSVWITLFDLGYDFCISSVTHYEVYSGATTSQLFFWRSILERTKVIPFDQVAAQIAVDINIELKRKRNQIDKADLFIAATAIANGLPLATLNKKHFNRIEALKLIE